MTRSIWFMALVLCLAALGGCCTIKIPAATVSQIANPEWVWASEKPRERVKADVCFRFPPCEFASKEEEEGFMELVRLINDIGGQLRPMVRRGELSREEFVGYSLMLEVISAQLLAYCEASQDLQIPEHLKPLYQHYAEALGVSDGIDAVFASRRLGKLDTVRAAVDQIEAGIARPRSRAGS